MEGNEKQKGERKEEKGEGREEIRRDDLSEKIAKWMRKGREKKEVLILLPTLGKTVFPHSNLPTHHPHFLSLHSPLFPSPFLPILFSFTSHFPSSSFSTLPSHLFPFSFHSLPFLPSSTPMNILRPNRLLFKRFAY